MLPQIQQLQNCDAWRLNNTDLEILEIDQKWHCMALQQPNVTSGDLIARRIYIRKFNHQICELQSREVLRHLFDGCVQRASFVARGLSGLSTVVGIEVPYTIMHAPIYHRIISYTIVYHRIPSYTIHSKIGEFNYSHN